MSDMRVYTTGEVAKFCGVTFHTVIRWIKKGRLQAHQLPGRGDNRITEDHLLEFLKENQMPLPAELADLGRRVLLVDDDELMTILLKEELSDSGYEVKIADDGFRAGAFLSDFAPQVMVLDLKMPRMSGFEVIRFVRESGIFADTKILAISGFGDQELEKAKKMGADATLAKPFRTDDLRTAIDSLFDSLQTPAKKKKSKESVSQAKEVLIIDDDENMVSALVRSLKPFRIFGIAAHDAKQGFKLALEKKPQLILLDWNMPIENGEDFLKKIKAHPDLNKIPVLVLTGEENPNLVEKAMSLGAESYLSKRYTSDDLLLIIKQCMRGGT